jgi:RNA polymerase sigma factor (sigma-70 family)
VRVLSKLGQFRGADETDDEQARKLFRGWIRRVAHTVLVNRSRRRVARRPAVSLRPPRAGESMDGGVLEPPARGPTGSANVRTAEQSRLIQEALDSLPDPTDREIMRRRFFEEQTLEVIAAELGLTYDQVRERCRKSMNRLQHVLKGLLDEQRS